MKKVFSLLVVACFALSAQAQTPEVVVLDKESFIEVSATAERKVDPNEIEVSITLEQTGINEKVPVDRQQRNLISALDKAGIPATERLKIEDVSNSLREAFLRKDEVRTSKRFTLTLHTPQELTTAFAIFNQLGISNANVSKATRNDFDTLKAELRAEAMRNAKAMADTLAESVGQKAGKAFWINDSGYMAGEGGSVTRYGVMLKSSNMMDSAMPESAAEESLQFNKLQLRYTINAKFYLF